MNATEEEAKAFLKNPDEKMLGMIRVSFGLYNTIKEVHVFLNVVEDICNGRFQ